MIVEIIVGLVVTVSAPFIISYINKKLKKPKKSKVVSKIDNTLKGSSKFENYLDEMLTKDLEADSLIKEKDEYIPFRNV